MLPLFVYGTLQIPAIMQTVTGRQFAARPGILNGYAAWSLREVVYPGLCPAAGHRTSGLVLAGVDARALRRLDRHEGAEYRRSHVTVRLIGGGLVRAQTYLLQPSEYHRIRRHLWHLTTFSDQELSTYTPYDGRWRG